MDPVFRNQLVLVIAVSALLDFAFVAWGLFLLTVMRRRMNETEEQLRILRRLFWRKSQKTEHVALDRRK